MLRRPIETTRVTGHLGSGTNISAAENSSRYLAVLTSFFRCVRCSILRPPEGVRYNVKRTVKGENGERGREDSQVLGVRRVGMEAQAGLPVLLEKQRRHAGCARLLDGVDVHDARSGTACRAPTGRNNLPA